MTIESGDEEELGERVPDIGPAVPAPVIDCDAGGGNVEEEGTGAISTCEVGLEVGVCVVGAD